MKYCVQERENECETVNFKETLTSRWPMELDHKLIESAEDGDLVLALNAASRLRKRQQQKNKQQDRKTVLKSKNVELQRSVI